jgi:hypothetical protein
MARCITNTNFVSTWSDVASVTINPKPFIHITSPTKGETWVVNTPHTITWDSGYLTSGTLYLYYWYGGKWHPIDAFPTPGTTQNSYPWTIPDIHDPLTSPKPKGDIQSIKVWIGNWANGRWECWDTNDPDFRILDDGWVFTISNPKGEKGGATLWFDDNAFDGYGVSFGFETFRVNQGAYDVDNQGIMSGTFTLTGLQSAESVSGNLTGSVNPNATKMTLVLKDSNGSAVFNMAGIRLLSEPDILGDWSTTISGDATGGFDPLTIDSFQDGGEVFSHIFGVSGSGTTGSGSVNIQGTFFFTPATKTDSYGNVIGNIVYGVYEMTVGVNEAGVISGTINPNKGKFTFNLTSDNGNKYKLVGHILPP